MRCDDLVGLAGSTSPAFPIATSCDNHPSIAAMSTMRMSMEQQLPARGARGHRRHAANAALLPKCVVNVSTTVIGQRAAPTREPHKEFSRSGKFACGRKSRSLHFPSQEAQQRHDGILHGLPTGTNSIRNRSALLCDNRNAAKKPGPRTPRTKKSPAHQKNTFSATTTTTTGQVLHNEIRPKNVAAPARPRLGASSSIYIPQASMSVAEN